MIQETAREELQLLVFELAGVRYGLELGCVREVVRAVLIAPLPGAPAVVEGVISVRGEVVPVYDFRARFRLPPRPLHPDDLIIIAWTGTRRVGIRCERTDWMAAVPVDAVQPPPDFAAGSSEARIAGVARRPDGLILIHDLPRFLDAAEEEALDRATQGHSL
jgi:purine-binding chemotaxis protein CheW